MVTQVAASRRRVRTRAGRADEKFRTTRNFSQALSGPCHCCLRAKDHCKGMRRKWLVQTEISGPWHETDIQICAACTAFSPVSSGR